MARLAEVACGYSNLEYDLEAGRQMCIRDSGVTAHGILLPKTGYGRYGQIRTGQGERRLR